MKTLLSAALLAIGAPALAQPLPPQAAAPPAAAPSAATPQAALPVDPQRLALARVTVDALFPAGTTGRLVAGMMSGSAMQGMLDVSPPDLGIGGDKAPKSTLRDQLKKSDPHFEQRMTITGRVVGEEMARLAPQFETPLRAGLAESVARRFTPVQLTDLNRFFATDSGRAFGRELWLLWMDPAVFKGIVATLPVMMKEMPAVLKKVDSATAHLPRPKAPADKKPVKEPK